MILSTVKYGATRWDLTRTGNQHYLRITTSQERYLYPVALDTRHQRFHPSTEDLMTMDPMDLKALNMLGKKVLGEPPRSNPTGAPERLPMLLKRRVAVVLQSMMRKEAGRPSKEMVGRAFGTATGMLQRGGYMRKGTRDLTPSGKAKQEAITPEKRAEADQIFSAWVEGRAGEKKPKARATKAVKAQKQPQRKPTRKAKAPSRRVEASRQPKERSRKVAPVRKMGIRDMILSF